MQWEISGTVLASQNGNASFSIEVLDLAGNKGSPVTATDDNTQVVLDTTTPTLSGITLVSTNANDSQAFAKPGDNITLSFNSSEPIQIPSITLADNDSLTVHDTSSDQDGTSWKVVYTVTSGETERDTSFSIDFKDIAGNEGVSKDQTYVTNTIKIDTSIPTLSVVSLSEGTNNLANEGDVVTLSFTGSENLRNPLVKLVGERQELSGTQQTWSTIYSVKAKDDAGKSPYGMEELVLWLDATNIDGRLNYSLNDGDAVSEWKDLSGNEKHLIQESNDESPNYVNSDNGEEISFDGTNDSLKSRNNLDITSNSTVLFVAEMSSNSSFKPLIGIETTSNGLYYGIYTGSETLSITQNRHDNLNEGFSHSHSTWIYKQNFINNSFINNDFLLSFRIFDEQYDENLDNLLINGKRIDLLNYNSNSLYPQDVGPLRLGKVKLSGADHLLDGSFKEIIIFNRALSKDEMGNIQSYLSNKWNLTSTVDSDGDGLMDAEDDAPAGLIVESKPVLFNIVFEDEAGNQGIMVDNTTDSSFVGIDTTKPNFWMFPSFLTTWIIPPPGKMIRSL